MSEPFDQEPTVNTVGLVRLLKRKMSVTLQSTHRTPPPPFLFCYGEETPLKIKRDPKGWSHKAKE